MNKLSLEQLFFHWRIANNRATFYMQKYDITQLDKDAIKFAHWNNRVHVLYVEIERRAELFPVELVLNLIDTCCTFSFNDKKEHI